MVSQTEWKAIISELEKTAAPGKYGFRPLDPGGGQRHGGWVWTCADRSTPGIVRYATFTLTDVAGLTPQTELFVEVQSGADNGRFYVQRSVRGFKYAETSQLAGSLYKDIIPTFVEAMQAAQKFEAADLKEPYPIALSG